MLKITTKVTPENVNNAPLENELLPAAVKVEVVDDLNGQFAPQVGIIQPEIATIPPMVQVEVLHPRDGETSPVKVLLDDWVEKVMTFDVLPVATSSDPAFTATVTTKAKTDEVSPPAPVSQLTASVPADAVAEQSEKLQPETTKSDSTEVLTDAPKAVKRSRTAK